MKELVSRLAKEFANKEYAHAYMESHSVSRLAAQIFALRKKCGWSQQQLAERAGLAQERVSKIESADFDSLTMKTLRKFSRAFDVNLQVSFQPFGAGILDVVNLKPEGLAVETRVDELNRLKNSRYLLSGDGDWIAVERPAMQVITGSISTASSVTPRNDWQDLDVSPSLRQIA